MNRKWQSNDDKVPTTNFSLFIPKGTKTFTPKKWQKTFQWNTQELCRCNFDEKKNDAAKYNVNKNKTSCHFLWAVGSTTLEVMTATQNGELIAELNFFLVTKFYQDPWNTTRRIYHSSGRLSGQNTNANETPEQYSDSERRALWKTLHRRKWGFQCVLFPQLTPTKEKIFVEKGSFVELVLERTTQNTINRFHCKNVCPNNIFKQEIFKKKNNFWDGEKNNQTKLC